MTILVVDDDPVVLNVLERLLKARGYVVLTAQDSLEAALVLSQQIRPPDLLLVDVALKDENGVEYAERFRARYPATAIVLTTGFVDREPVAARRGLGPVLRKPFEPNELYAIIDALERREPA